jgi:hypothetical protein
LTVGDRRGFVLAVVVFMLFAISITAVTGYLVVSSEFELSRGSGQGAEALTVARAGLERFVAEQLGVVGDSASYALGDGIAQVTSRKVMEQDSVTDLYYIRSEGTVDDVFTPGSPARRVVGAYAVHRRRPLPHHAAVMIGANRVDVEGDGEAHGQDYSGPSDCAGGGASTISGLIATLAVTEENGNDIQGSPQWQLWGGGWSAMRDSIRVRWDILSDPDFPVEFENTLPDFGGLPADSFPVIRYTGWVNAGWAGRGVLIVDGVFDPFSGFSWDGIVIAKHIDDIVEGEIDGMLIAGIAEPNMYSTVSLRTDVNYHFCFVYAANESLSYLELLPNTVFEAN